jgi:hypothetical protein
VATIAATMITPPRGQHNRAVWHHQPENPPRARCTAAQRNRTRPRKLTSAAAPSPCYVRPA